MPLERQFLDASTLTDPELFKALISLLPIHTHQKISSYYFLLDRALSLGSSLLQYRLLFFHQPPLSAFNSLESLPLIPKDPLTNRPYPPSSFSAIADFNVSHHNPREAPAGLSELAPVVLASRICSRGRIGVDVVPTRSRDGAGLVDALVGENDNMSVFTPWERAEIIRAANSGSGSGSKSGVSIEGIRILYLYWSLKEAYFKAIGTGIVNELTRVEFRGVNIENTKKRWGENVKIFVDKVDETEKWHIEISFLQGRTAPEGDGFFVVVCTESDGLEEEDMLGPWREVDCVDILKLHNKVVIK